MKGILLKYWRKYKIDKNNLISGKAVVILEEKDILKRLIKNDALFNYVYVINQRYDILPDDKEHTGTYIKYQDTEELR